MLFIHQCCHLHISIEHFVGYGKTVHLVFHLISIDDEISHFTGEVQVLQKKFIYKKTFTSIFKKNMTYHLGHFPISSWTERRFENLRYC